MTVLVAVARSGDPERILREGEQLAERFDEDLEVVHVMSRDEFVKLERTSVSNTDEVVDIDGVRAAAADIARERAEAFVDGFKATGLVGDPASEVVTLAGKRDARYVVIGVRKRSAVGKAIFGSTAQKILVNSECSVVVVPRAKVTE